MPSERRKANFPSSHRLSSCVGSETSVGSRSTKLAALGIPLSLSPMEAKLVTDLPADAGWQFEPKWDGFRCLAFRAGNEVEIRAKSGKSLSRFFPEVVINLATPAEKNFVLDGELVIPVDGELSFDALQMRLHPAESRIKRLAQERPATLVIFDCLLRKLRQPLLKRPFEERRAALEAFFESIGSMSDWQSRRLRATCAKQNDGSTTYSYPLTVSSPSLSVRPTSPASGPCSRSNVSAQQIASSAAFGTRADARW